MIDDVVITDHAVKRFIDRTVKLGGAAPREPRKAIQRLLASSEPENIGSGHVIERLLNNGFKEASYLVSNGWRFVIVDNVMVTVERVKREQN